MNKDELLKQIKETKKNRNIELRKVWDSLITFENENDVPELPITTQKEWDEYYVAKLFELGAIPKKELIHGDFYLGSHPKIKIARWNKMTNKFEFWDDKEPNLLKECNHFEDDDGYILFVPIKKSTKKEFDGQKN
jgi:hypothetical protein